MLTSIAGKLIVLLILILVALMVVRIIAAFIPR